MEDNEGIITAALVPLDAPLHIDHTQCGTGKGASHYNRCFKLYHHKKKVTIGRGLLNDIKLIDKRVSRSHAELNYEEVRPHRYRWFITLVSPRVPLQVNDQVLNVSERVRLIHNDEIQLFPGGRYYRFEYVKLSGELENPDESCSSSVASMEDDNQNDINNSPTCVDSTSPEPQLQAKNLKITEKKVSKRRKSNKKEENVGPVTKMVKLSSPFSKSEGIIDVSVTTIHDQKLLEANRVEINEQNQSKSTVKVSLDTVVEEGEISQEEGEIIDEVQTSKHVENTEIQSEEISETKGDNAEKLSTEQDEKIDSNIDIIESVDSVKEKIQSEKNYEAGFISDDEDEGEKEIGPENSSSTTPVDTLSNSTLSLEEEQMIRGPELQNQGLMQMFAPGIDVFRSWQLIRNRWPFNR